MPEAKLNAWICFTGLRKKNGEDVKVTVSLPVELNFERYCIVSIDGFFADQKIYGEDSVGTLMNALSYLHTLLDRPPAKIADQLDLSSNDLSALSAHFCNSDALDAN